MEIFKKEYKASLLVLGYIAVAELVYVTLLLKTTGKWYFALIVGVLILIAGIIIGYFYVKSEYNAHNKKEELKEPIEKADDIKNTESSELKEEVINPILDEDTKKEYYLRGRVKWKITSY